MERKGKQVSLTIRQRENSTDCIDGWDLSKKQKTSSGSKLGLEKWQRISYDVCTSILSFLNQKDLCSVFLICKCIHLPLANAARDNIFWKPIYTSLFFQHTHHTQSLNHTRDYLPSSCNQSFKEDNSSNPTKMSPHNHGSFENVSHSHLAPCDQYAPHTCYKASDSIKNSKSNHHHHHHHHYFNLLVDSCRNMFIRIMKMRELSSGSSFDKKSAQGATSLHHFDIDNYDYLQWKYLLEPKYPNNPYVHYRQLLKWMESENWKEIEYEIQSSYSTLIMGSHSVGKTSFVLSASPYLDTLSLQEIPDEIGSDHSVKITLPKSLKLTNQDGSQILSNHIEVLLLDKYVHVDQLKLQPYLQKDFYLAMFDVSRLETLIPLVKQLEILRKHKPNMRVILLGNKCDLKTIINVNTRSSNAIDMTKKPCYLYGELVPFSVAQEVSRSIGAVTYIEISCKESCRLFEVLYCLVAVDVQKQSVSPIYKAMN